MPKERAKLAYMHSRLQYHATYISSDHAYEIMAFVCNLIQNRCVVIEMGLFKYLYLLASYHVTKFP